MLTTDIDHRSSILLPLLLALRIHVTTSFLLESHNASKIILSVPENEKVELVNGNDSDSGIRLGFG